MDRELEFSRRAVAAAVIFLGSVLAFVLYVSTPTPAAPIPKPSPTPWVVPVTTLPGLESQIADNPAVLACWLKAGDRWSVERSVEFPIGLYVQVSATVDGKDCYGWVKDWK